MVTLQELETAIPLNSETITYKPLAGEVALVRPKDLLLKAGKEINLSFTEHQGGVISAPVNLDDQGNPGTIVFWDKLGRICKEKSYSVVGGGTFTNLYEFDIKGRLIVYKQMIKGKGKTEKLYRMEEYQYVEGRPDNQYTATYTEQKGNVQTWDWKKRKQDLRTDVGKTYKA